ncbi:MAG: hypothetical protein JWO17_1058 [Actinomycetia bacterium]|nr:hypothetical protein [Actinomycetes bacterium]
MRRLVVLLVLVVATALASTVGTAKAGLIGGNCGATAPVFAPWGDWSSYYFAPNGGFENGSAGWTLGGGAAVVAADNEPWYLAGFGSHALEISTGGSASINVCYGVTYPAVRFFVAGQNGPARVHVRVVTRSLLGPLSVLDGGTFTADQGWNPSPKTSTLLSSLASLVGTKTMQLQFTVESGTAQIDDLFVDPFLSKS